MKKIYPYKLNGQWIFDDPRVGLHEEPFVFGADDIIELVTSSIPHADTGFTLTFSDAPFDGHQFVFIWRREDEGGNWYYNAGLGMEGWLCPALFKYFKTAPKLIYAKFSQLEGD